MALSRLAGISALAAAVLLVSAIVPATAFADPGNGRNQPFLADVISGPALDRVTIGHSAKSCTVTVEPGRIKGGFGPAIVVNYKLAELKGRPVTTCPDIGAALTTPRRYDDLAVTWFSSPLPSAGPQAFILRDFREIGGGSGGLTPSYAGSQDFNGDGKGDLWETTDEGEGFTTYVRSGNGFVPGPLHFASSNTAPVVSFGELDGQPGVDVTAGYTNFSGAPSAWSTGALVGFGGSGTVKILESDPTASINYATSLLDANHDGFVDVEVSGGPNPPRIYLNDGAGDFTLAP